MSIARNLTGVSRSRGGGETGIHSDLQIAVTSRVAKILALDPAVGSLTKAQELLSAFRQTAAEVHPNGCMLGA